MRLFLFLLILSSASYAQIDVGVGTITNCTEADILNGGDIQCGDLILDDPFSFNPGAAAVNIRVTGNVTISTPVNLDGFIGQTGDQFQDFTGDPGPGGDPGGSTNFASPPLSGLPPSGGTVGDSSGTCGGGGAGAGFGAAAPADGEDCGLILGGLAGPAFGAIFTGPLRGGFGGGAGGAGSALQVGSGGGGGGALRIRAGGNITITIAASITATGGIGGSSGLADGGGGGGGSGGLIWIQALGNITNNGSLLAAGAAGGNGDGTSGDGSAGGNGAILLEDLDGIISGTNVLPSYGNTASLNPVTSSNSLKSDISCGMIKPAEDKDHSQFFQMIMGFLLVMSASFLINRLKFFSKTQV